MRFSKIVFKTINVSSTLKRNWQILWKKASIKKYGTRVWSYNCVKMTLFWQLSHSAVCEIWCQRFYGRKCFHLQKWRHFLKRNSSGNLHFRTTLIIHFSHINVLLRLCTNDVFFVPTEQHQTQKVSLLTLQSFLSVEKRFNYMSKNIVLFKRKHTFSF